MNSKFSDKCKNCFPRRKGHAYKVLEDQPQKLIRWTRPLLTSTPFTSGLICAKCRRGRFDHFKHFETHKSWTFALLILQDSYFSVQSILLVSADFCLWKGKKMNCITKSNNLPTLIPYPRVTTRGCSGVIRVKMFVLKHWVSWRIFGILTNGNR